MPRSRGLNVKRINTRVCSNSEVTAVGLNSDGSTVLASFKGGPVKQQWVESWDMRSDKSLAKVAGHSAVFHPTEKSLLVAKEVSTTIHGAINYVYGSSVALRGWTNGKTQIEFKDAIGDPLAISPDGRFVAAGTSRNRLAIYNAASGHMAGLIMSHFDQITHAIFTPDNNSVVTLSKDSTVRISYINGPSRAKMVVDTSQTPQALAITPDGKAIVSIWGSAVNIWYPDGGDLTTYSLNAVRQLEGWPLTISSDCQYLVCRTDGGFDISDVFSGEVLANIAIPTSPVTSAAISGNNGVVAIGKLDGTVEVFGVSPVSA
jgi:WD40 repeat protein